VATYELCPRKWAWAWLDGIVAPPNKFADFGIKTHRHLELWLKKGVPPGGGPEARLAQIMIPHLPPPHLVKPANVETEVRIAFDDVIFVMKLDCWMPDVDPPRVYDHKTTSSFDWSLSAEALVEDVQATLYGAWAFVAAEVDRVQVQWTYGLSRGAPQVKPVTRVLNPREIQPRLLHSIQSAREMRAIMESGCRAIEVSYNAASCEAFGGCPYQDKCNLTARDRLQAIVAQGTAKETGKVKEDFLQKLKDRNSPKKNNGKPAGASPGQVNPPQASAPAPASAPAASVPKIGKLAAQLAARAAPAPAPEPEPEPEPPAPEPEAAADESPKRGRPRGSSSAKVVAAPMTPGERWSLFAGATVRPIMSAFTAEQLSDPEMQEAIAEAAAGYADALMKEYASRFEA
jgi:hypothetical protein